MSEKKYLTSLEISERSRGANVYSKEYVFNGETINRDGLFFSLFNKIFDSVPSLPHAYLSRFELFSGHEYFYQIYSQEEERRTQKTLILFHLNRQECPLELLEDFLKWFKKKETRLFAHYNYNLDLTSLEDQKYLLGYFQLLQKYLGEMPEMLSTLDLEKMASFEGWRVVEGGTQWHSLDNYLVHLVLSKGAVLGSKKLEESFEVVDEWQLSPFHGIQKIRIPGVGRRLIACEFAEDLKRKNFYKHPEDLKLFYYMIYKNIFL